MHKLAIVFVCAIGLAGCASEQQFVKQHISRPQARVVPTPVVVAPVQPTVTVVPATPVPTGTFKMRWLDRVESGAKKVRSHIHFHKKDK